MGQEPKEGKAHKLLAPGQLAVKRRLGVPKTRSCLRVSGISPNIQISPFNNNIATLRRAVTERVFLVKENGEFMSPPKPAPGLFEERLGHLRASLVSTFPVTAPLSLFDTVNTFTGCKRRRYERAFENISYRRGTVADEAKVQVFVKYEKTDRTTKDDPVPRVISPRTPEFNLRLASYLRRIEEPMFDALGELFGHKTVMKGVTNERTAELMMEKWNMFHEPVAVGLDASRFDQHVSKEALQFEHSIYPLCFVKKTRRKLHYLLNHQLRNKCAGWVEDGSLKYETEGTRMSGDMNTSLGNCVLMCMMIKGYSEFCGVNLQLANNGDDCVVFMERKDLEKFSVGLRQWFLEMGFNMVVENPSKCFEQIEFCQTRPVFDGTKWVMCRNPWTGLAKDSVLLKDPKQVSSTYFKQWLDAVGTGGIALAGGMPVFQSFYKMYQRSGISHRKNCKGKRIDMNVSGIVPWYMREAGLTGVRNEMSVTPDARSSFYYAFGITPDEQECLESYYDGLLISTEPSRDWHPREVFPFKI